ncbi:MAG: hypothetical protein H7330_11150, partial [Hymenobacteraceae bacterium]|nr:hypothetical protein [Hymenobacteraceae bacterium]
MSAEPTDSHAKDAARHRELARLRDEAIARLEGDPAVQEWLAQFQDGDSFLTYYAERRADYLTYGPDWQRHFERQARADAAAGLDRLWQIQQRKLFRAQCQWRAEELMLPAKWVEVSRDFDIWGERIHECPFLDPITPEEVEQYAAYLHSDECEDTDPDVMPVLIWQFYAKYRIWREAEERGDDPVEAVLGPKPADVPDFLHYGTLSVWRYPEWYIWADDHLPEPNWLYLPDRRGAKEAYYEQLASQQADQAPKPAMDRVATAPQAPPPPPPV